MNRLFSFFQSSLQRRLILYLLPLIIIPVAVVFFVFNAQLTTTALENIQVAEEERLSREKVEIDLFLSTVEQDINFLASKSEINRLVGALLVDDAETVASARSIVTDLLFSLAENRQIYKQMRVLDVTGNEVIRINNDGTSTTILPQSGLQNKADRHYFVETIKLPENGLYVSPLDLTREGTPPTIFAREDGALVPVIRYAKPLYVTNINGAKQLAGIVIINVAADNVFEFLKTNATGTRQYLVNSDGYFLYNEANREFEFGFEDGIEAFGKVAGATVADAFPPQVVSGFRNARLGVIDETDVNTDSGRRLIHYTPVRVATTGYSWVLVSSVDIDLLLEPTRNAAAAATAVFVAFIGFAVVGITLIARQITQPVIAISQQAEKLAQGDFDVQLGGDGLSRQDEVGVLGRSFRAMSSQLKDLLLSLEQRVQSRTEDLATSAEIASAANQVRELDDLISLTVNLVRDRFDFYYVQVYLIDDEKKFAVLRDGTGYVGRRLLSRNHRLPLDGRSLVAQTIRTGNQTLVPDTQQDANFLPNELLPDTRSELVVPLVANRQIIGVLDIQHNQPNAFSEDSIQLFQTLSNQLAVTFDNVDLFESSQRRAREMETVAEVSIQAAQNLDTDILLRNAMRLTRDNFNLYHAQVYLVNERENVLELASGSGEAGLIMKERGHKIPLSHEHSLVALSARTNEPVIVNDVTANPDFLPNELLPLTRSEMVVPLRVGNQVIGVLDVQSEKANRFDEEDAKTKQTLANQIAVAVQNARTFEAVERTRQIVADNAARLSAVTGNFPNGAIVMYDKDYRYLLVDGLGLEEAGLNKEAMEGKTLWDVFPKDVADNVRTAYQSALDGKETNAEIPFGELVYQTISLPVRDQNGEIIAGMTITQNITERKRLEREQEVILLLSGRLNLAKSSEDVLYVVADYLQELQATTANIFYIETDDVGIPIWANVVGGWTRDAKQFNPLPTNERYYLPDLSLTNLWTRDPSQPVFIAEISADERVDENSRAIYQQFGTVATVIIPLAVEDRWIGLVTIDWNAPHPFDDQMKRIFTTFQLQAISVVDALQNIEIATKRSKELQTVANVSAASSTNLDMATLLVDVANLTKERFGLYHAHIYLLDTAEKNLVLAGGAGEAGAEMLRRKFRIPLSREHSLVARAARTRQGVVSNDVRQEPDFLPNELLPDTRAEMAVPMIIGDELIGVLDVQSAQTNRFNAEDVRVKTTLATQIAVAVKNARLFKEVNDIRYAIDQHAIVAITDQRGIINYVNDRFIEISKYSREELIGQDHRIINSGHHPEEFIKGLWTTLANGGTWQGKFKNKAKDGSIYWVDTTIVPFLNDEGKPYQYIAIRADITEQVANEEQIIRRAKELETVAKVSATTTTILNLDELLGSVVALTRDSFDLYHAQVYLLDEESKQLVLAQGAGTAGERMKANRHAISVDNPTSIVARVARHRKGFISNNVAADASFLPNPLLPLTQSEMAVPMLVGDELIGVLDVQSEKLDRFTDEDLLIKTTLADQIAVAVRNAQAFDRERRTIERLREVDRLKQEFLANMSHELRTPLNSIIGYSEVLIDGVDGDLTDEAVEDVQAIHHSGKHLLSIINEILDLAKIEAGQMQLNQKPVDIVPILQEVVNTNQILVKDKPVELVLAGDIPSITVNADKMRLQQVIINLLGNAVKFTEQGVITVRYRRDGDNLVIAIEDTGIGMKPDDLAVIFERFRQADGSSTRRAGGTGLGLTITRQLVTMHGGDIFVESEFGVGSKFWFTLPIYVDETKQEPVAGD